MDIQPGPIVVRTLCVRTIGTRRVDYLLSPEESWAREHHAIGVRLVPLPFVVTTGGD